ncbi:MAG: DUF1347 family protein [Chlamydiia bacterium]|nr:DUF1347 family protein [Chlamydiia bacterium]
MANLRTAIFGTGVILAALVGFFYFGFGADYHLDNALDSFSRGQFEEASATIDKAKSGLPPARYLLLKAYVSRPQNHLQEAQRLLASALQQAPRESTNLRFEILLNQALTAQLLGDVKAANAALSDAELIYPDDGYLVLLKGLNAYTAGDFDTAIYHWQRPLVRTGISPWVHPSFDKVLAEDAIKLQLAHAYIEQGKALAARQLLEDLRKNTQSAEKKDQILFLIGSSYVTEATSKPSDAASSYYRLVLSYWNRIPLQNSSMKEQRATALQWASSAAENLAAGRAWTELGQMLKSTESWGDSTLSSKYQGVLNEQFKTALKEGNGDDARVLAQTLDSLFSSPQQRQTMVQMLVDTALDSLDNGRIAEAELSWEALKQVSSDSSAAASTLGPRARKMILKQIPADTEALESTQRLLTFWQKLQPDENSGKQFAEELIGSSKALWLTAGSEKKAFALMRAASQLASASNQGEINDDIEDTLQAVYGIASKEDQVDKLPEILEAVRHFQITSINLRDPNSAANYLADAISHFKAGRYQQARQRCEWIVTIFPENTAAQTLLGAIAYLQHDYAAAVEHLSQSPNLTTEQEEALAISQVITGKFEEGLRRLDALTEKGVQPERNDKIRIALGLLSERQPQKALDWFSLVLDTDETVWAGQALAYAALGNWSEALALLEQVTTAPAAQSEVLALHSLALAAQQRTDASYAKLQWALGTDSKESSSDLGSALTQAFQKGYPELSANLVAAMYFLNIKHQPTTAQFYLDRAHVDTADTRLLQAQIHLATGKTGEAETFLLSALTLAQHDPMEHLALKLLSEIYSSQGRWDQACDIFGQLHEADPEDSMYAMRQAQILAQQKRWDLALKVMSKLNAEHRLPMEATELYTEALIRTGNDSLVEDIITRWLGQEKMIPLEQGLQISTLLTGTPNGNLTPRILQGHDTRLEDLKPTERVAMLALLAKSGAMDSARELVDSYEAELSGTIKGLLLSAEVRAAFGHTKEALDLLHKAEMLSPYDPDVLAALEQLETDPALIQGRIARIRTQLNRENPSLTQIVALSQQLINFAIESESHPEIDVQDRSEAISEAAQRLQILVGKKPLYPEVYLRLGQTFLFQKNLQSAHDAFEKALTLSATYSEAHKYLAHCEKLLNKPELAKKHLDAALYWTPNDVDAWKMAGALGIEQHRLLDARIALSNLIRFQPGNIDALVTLGGVLIQMKNPEEARIVLERATKLDPANLSGLSLLLASLSDPTLYLEEGERHQARVLQVKTYEQIQRLDPERAKQLAERFGLPKLPDADAMETE